MLEKLSIDHFAVNRQTLQDGMREEGPEMRAFLGILLHALLPAGKSSGHTSCAAREKPRNEFPSGYCDFPFLLVIGNNLQCQ